MSRELRGERYSAGGVESWVGGGESSEEVSEKSYDIVAVVVGRDCRIDRE